ncbi:MAG: radical SAM protein [Chlorobi bacterium]|nr:radical SAM protein [Chlorobiota bacterium]
MKTERAYPVYVDTWKSGRLEEKTGTALSRLSSCTLCPRMCRVNRLKEEKGICRTGCMAVVSSAHPHYGEESPISGYHGSGTIFFSNCNLGCVFCQNADISHMGTGSETDAETLAGIMLALQGKGCHNINLVTPSHVIPQILEALSIAIPSGLRTPLVYNTSGYDRVSSLHLLDGVIDIYMPDFKCWDPEVAGTICHAHDYPDVARKALREMYRQVGDLQTDERGVAVRGLLVRHLVLPEDLAGTASVMNFLTREVSPETFVNIMDQYHPAWKARETPGLERSITAREYNEALRLAMDSGLNVLD